MSPWIRHVRSRLLAGLLFVLPFVATVWVVQLLFRLIDTALTTHALRLAGLEDQLAWSVVWLLRLGSLLGVALVLYVLGLLATNVVGRRLLRAGDAAVGRVPLVGAVYRATRQVMDAVGAGSTAAFRRCVLVEYPRAGIWTLAFVTNETPLSLPGAPDDCLSLFVPTTPNPTSGYFVVMPRSACRPLAISVEEGVKMIVSAGIVTPPALQAPPGVPREAGQG